jgi:hypothetical protein
MVSAVAGELESRRNWIFLIGKECSAYYSQVNYVHLILIEKKICHGGGSRTVAFQPFQRLSGVVCLAVTKG